MKKMKKIDIKDITRYFIIFQDNELVEKKFFMFPFDGDKYKTFINLYYSLMSNDIGYKKEIKNYENLEEIKFFSEKLLENKYTKREDWKKIKEEALKLSLFLLFSQNENLKINLVETLYDEIYLENNSNLLMEYKVELPKIIEGIRFSFFSSEDRERYLCINLLKQIKDILIDNKINTRININQVLQNIYENKINLENIYFNMGYFVAYCEKENLINAETEMKAFTELKKKAYIN